MTAKAKDKSPHKSQSKDRSPDFRELVADNDRKIYQFCALMISDASVVEDLVLEIFREFGELHRKGLRGAESGFEPLEMRLSLYRIAWDRVREWLAKSSFPWTVGRDTRELTHVELDVLEQSLSNQDVEGLEADVMERVRWVDPEFRAPLVLHDLLQFEHEEVLRILGLRWGVYRHRLNRGRLDFKDSLRGRPSTFIAVERTS